MTPIPSLFATPLSSAAKFVLAGASAAIAISALPIDPIGVASGADWPQYLGPNRDGTSDETGWNSDWIAKEPKRAWEAEVGMGCASFVVVDGKAITTGNADDEDTIWCLDAETGKLVWKHAYKEPLAPKYYPGGTSATPTVDGGHVYSISKAGKLYCLELATGKVVWMKDFESDFDGKQQTWGWATAPLIVGDKLLVDPGAKGGAAMALDKKSGKTLWKSGDAQPGYSAPVVYKGKAGESVAFFHGKQLAGYALADGEEQFEFPWETSYDVNAAMPLFRNGRFFIGSGYGTGVGVVDISGTKPKEVWSTKDLQLQFQNALLLGDRVCAVFGDAKQKATFAWVEFDTGKVLWKEQLSGNRGTVIKVGGKLIVFTENGELLVGTADDSGFEEEGRVQVLPKLCWAAPAFADGRIFLRNNDGKAVCLDVNP